MRLGKECIVHPSMRLPSIKDSAQQFNSLPTTRDMPLSHGLSSYHLKKNGKEGLVSVSSDLEAQVSASFSEGFIKVNQGQRQSAEYIDLFFFLFFFFFGMANQSRQFHGHYQMLREYNLTLRLTLFSLRERLNKSLTSTSATSPRNTRLSCFRLGQRLRS